MPSSSTFFNYTFGSSTDHHDQSTTNTSTSSPTTMMNHNAYNTSLFSCHEDWPSTLEFIFAPSCVMLRLEFALNFDEKLYREFRRVYRDVGNKNSDPALEAEEQIQKDRIADELFSLEAENKRNKDVFSGCCHVGLGAVFCIGLLFYAPLLSQQAGTHWRSTNNTASTTVSRRGKKPKNSNNNTNNKKSDETNNNKETETPSSSSSSSPQSSLISDEQVDCCVGLFCAPLRMCQLYREVTLRGIPMPNFWLDRAETRTLSYSGKGRENTALPPQVKSMSAMTTTTMMMQNQTRNYSNNDDDDDDDRNSDREEMVTQKEPIDESVNAAVAPQAHAQAEEGEKEAENEEENANEGDEKKENADDIGTGKIDDF